MSSNQLGPVILDIAGQELLDEERALLSSPAVGGLIFFSRNYRDPEQLQALVREVRAVRPDIVLAVDQEGGRVQRFREGFTRLPPMQQLGVACREKDDEGLALTRDCGWLMAGELLTLGLDISFAPVLDLDEQFSTIIGDRAFALEPDLAITAARAFMAGMHEAGMATTGKHFPGHGSVREDSHLELPIDTRSFDEVREHDLRPFQELVGELDAVMPAHLLFPEVDAQPVGFSSFWLQQVLRNDIGFDGVVFSDDLSMAGAAAVGNCCERAELALSAGCDAVLVCNSPEDARELVRYLESTQQPLSPRLGGMRAGASVHVPTRDEFLDSQRYHRTRRALAALSGLSGLPGLSEPRSRN